MTWYFTEGGGGGCKPLEAKTLCDNALCCTVGGVATPVGIFWPPTDKSNLTRSGRGTLYSSRTVAQPQWLHSSLHSLLHPGLSRMANMGANLLLPMAEGQKIVSWRLPTGTFQDEPSDSAPSLFIYRDRTVRTVIKMVFTLKIRELGWV